MSLPRHDGPLIFVLNPASGAHGGEDIGGLIARLLTAAGRRYELLPIQDPKQIERLATAAVARARETGGCVVAVGGDGTINAVAQSVVGSGVGFGVVPRGTFNYFARTHGIPQDAEAALGALLRAHPTPVQVGRVNGRIFLVNASLGLYPKLLEDREAHKAQFGRSRLVAMGSALRTLLREPHQLRLRIESERGLRELRTPTLFVGNNALQLRRLGISQAEDVAAGRGWLAALVLRPTSAWMLLWLALRGALGRLGEAEQIDTFAFHRLRVDPVRHRRIKVALDGEVMLMAKPLEFSVAAQPLILLMPAPEDRAEVA